MSNPFNTASDLVSTAWKDTFGTKCYHIFHGSMEMLILKYEDGSICGDYVNHDGWFDFTDREAELAYEAYGCKYIPLHKSTENNRIEKIEFMPWRINNNLFEDVFMQST